MIDFYIIKKSNEEPFLKESEPIFPDLEDTIEYLEFIKDKETYSNSLNCDYYIVRIEALDKSEIINAMRPGTYVPITKYKILNTITISRGDS